MKKQNFPINASSQSFQSPKLPKPHTVTGRKEAKVLSVFPGFPSCSMRGRSLLTCQLWFSLMKFVQPSSQPCRFATSALKRPKNSTQFKEMYLLSGSVFVTYIWHFKWMKGWIESLLQIINYTRGEINSTTSK